MPISLNLSKKGPSRPTPGKRKLAFGEDDSDAEETTTSSKTAMQEILTFDEESYPASKADMGTEASAKPKFGQAPKLKQSSAASLQAPSISTLRSTTQVTADVDESLFDYDDFLTARNAVDRERKATAATTSGKGTSYVSDLLAAAEQRKRDQDRARDKLLQKQREDEGDEFKDKESFVTEAYKQNQEETRKAEEAEMKREEEERKKRDAGMGMTAFHRNAMEEEDRRHREALEAAKRMKEKGVTAVDEDAEEEVDDLELAKKLKQQGRDIDINDDGEITDKRALLTGGLNIVAKPKPPPQPSSGKLSATQATTRPQNITGNFDKKKAMRERQTKMVAEQLEQAAKRAAEEEAEELEKRERASKSQKTATDISSAKERYLQRKREAAARGEG